MTKTGLLSALGTLLSKLPKEKNYTGYAHAAAIQPLDSKPETVEDNLRKWVKDTSGKILKDVIPEKFWSDHDLSKPSPVASLCPLDKNSDSDVVLLLVLWSWCSPKCYEAITVCLIYGALNWKTDDMFKPTHWLRSYVQCICRSALYARGQIRNQAEKESVPDMAKRTILLDAYALSQVVSNSSEWFGILTSKQIPTVILRLFVKGYLMEMKLQAKFMGSVKSLTVFSDNDRKIVTHVSIDTWFKRIVILPQLACMMINSPMIELVNELKKLRNTKNDETNENMRMATCRKISEKAAQKLGLDLSNKDNPVAGMLVVLTQLTRQMMDKKAKRIILNENSVLKIICPALVDAAIKKKCGFVLLKDVVTQTAPLFRNDFVKAVTNVIIQFITIDNAKENIPSSTEGVPSIESSASSSKSPKTNRLKKSLTKNAPTKKAPTKKSPTKETATFVEGGVGTQTSNSTSAVESVKKSSPEENGASLAAASKKRKKKSSQHTRKIPRTNVTLPQHNNKPKEDEEDIQLKRGSSGTPLFQLGNNPKKASPYKTPLIEYRPRNNTSRRRATSGEDKRGIETKKGSESKTKPIGYSDPQHGGTAKVCNHDVKHTSSDSSNLTDDKLVELASDTSKEHGHKGDKMQSPTVNRIQRLLAYFGEDCEKNSYRDRWARCEGIYGEHIKSFETAKRTKGNIIRDLVVIHLGLISVDKMVQTSKETNKVEKLTIHEMKSSMKSFDVKNDTIGEILSHLLVSFRPLESDLYVQAIIKKANATPGKCDRGDSVDNQKTYTRIQADLKRMKRPVK